MPTQKILNRIVTKKDGVSYVYKIGNVDGYLNPTDGLFYEESTYETPIQGTDEMIYVDLPTNHIYRYDATDPTPAFVQIGGSENTVFGYYNETDGKFYEEATFVTEIPGEANKIYIGMNTDTVYRYQVSTLLFIPLLANKADSATTLSGYGITDAYTQTETDSAISTAIEALDVSDTAVDGSYVTAVSETDGEISVTREAADTEPTEDSTKMLTSGGAYTDTQNIYVANGVLGAKNLLPYPYYNESSTNRGITFTSNSDGTVSYSGTASNSVTAYMTIIEGACYLKAGTYILSGGDDAYGGASIFLFDDSSLSTNYSGTYSGDLIVSGGYIMTATTSDSTVNWTESNTYGYEKTFTIDSPVYLRIQTRSVNTNYTSAVSGTIYPMIRFASDTDDTWQPYAQTNYELTQQSNTNTDAIADLVNVYGAKNLIPYPYYHANGRTSYGITYTVGTDGSVTANGTSTGSSRLYFTSGSTTLSTLDYFEEGKTYILSSGVGSSEYWIELSLYNTSTSRWELYRTNNANGSVTFTMPSDFSIYSYATIYIICPEGVTVSNLTFYPMLRLASIEDDTYAPYAKTNYELTQFAYDNAGSHNAVYRGKYLGDSVSDEQYAAISSGTFKDIYIGDYWTINNTTYRIAAFDYWYNTGDTACTTHHVVLVPDSNMYTATINSSNTTDGGYVGSEMYTTNLADALTTITTDFTSDHLLSHRELFTNAVTDGAASGWTWYDSIVNLMNESMVYGHNAWGSHHGYETGIDKTQLPIFALRPEHTTLRASWWLRDVVSSDYFANVNSSGSCGSHGVSYPLGVRPAFAIIG